MPRGVSFSYEVQGHGLIVTVHTRLSARWNVLRSWEDGPAYFPPAEDPGRIPNFILNPPNNPTALITQLRNNGWEYDSQTASGVTMVIGAKSNTDLDGSVNDNTYVVVEMALVSYLNQPEAATLYQLYMEIMFQEMGRGVPDGLTYTHEVRRNNNIVSVYMRVSGRYYILRNWNPPYPFPF